MRRRARSLYTLASIALIAALIAAVGSCRQRDRDDGAQATAAVDAEQSAEEQAPIDTGVESPPTAAAPPPPINIIPGRPPAEFATLTQGARQAVVNIRTEGDVTGGPASMYPNARPDPSLGSGFLIDRVKGYVLTNLHLVANASTLRVVFVGGQERGADIIGRAQHLDIALLQLGGRALPENIQPLPLGESDRMSVGEWVLALGNPFGGEVTASAGILSSAGGATSVFEPPQEQFRNLLHTDASVHRGNTGGPLLNLGGRVVGINLAAPDLGGRSNGIGFAVPATQVRRLFKQLEQGKVAESWLGTFVLPATSDEVQGCAVRGVRITQVVRAGPAAKAQLRVGDVITRFDGHDVDKPKLAALLRSTVPDQRVELTICRNGQALTRALVVEEKPN